MDELLYTQEDIDEWIRTCEELQERNRELKEELSEINQKIEQGTLIELPCKVGDIVYFAYPNDDNDKTIIDKGKVDGISHQKDGIWVYARYKSGLTYWHEQEEIGERLFLTREEAEKRLKELQE